MHLSRDNRREIVVPAPSAFRTVTILVPIGANDTVGKTRQPGIRIRSMPGKKQSVAYHEAGHAIADTNQRMRVKYCTIIPEDGCAGASVLCTPLREGASRARKEAAIISLFAGGIAQRKFDKHSVRHYH